MKVFAEKDKEPQMNADERRFIDFDFQRYFEVYPENDLIQSPQRTQRAQSAAILTTRYVEVLQQRYRTRMTRIRRIFTDLFRLTDIFNPCASVSSVQSVFYLNPSGASAFIRVHLRFVFIKAIGGV